jgi:sterol desaturase/sphingolipid hydroxylase (fatty acid hydroxylase superfamily)
LSPSTEMLLRVGSYVLVFAALAAWEFLAPRRRLLLRRAARWPHNLGILLVDIAAVRLLVPSAAVGIAVLAEARGFGLMSWAALPLGLRAIAGFIALDLIIYAQHWLFHHVPLLWRLHRMHHADLEVDVTTGLRFHPVEILLSTGIKLAIVAAVGAPAAAVVIFEVLLNATSIFNHSNIRIPVGIDRILRWFVVTPDMHRVHHSILRRETNSNFGFNLPW